MNAEEVLKEVIEMLGYERITCGDDYDNNDEYNNAYARQELAEKLLEFIKKNWKKE